MQRSPLDPTAVSASGPPPSATENNSGTPPPPAQTTDVSGAIVPVKQEKKKKPNNGWTPSLELLVAEWADKAACYRWMHDKSSARYGYSNLWLTFPVILLSTITGTASFGINGLLPDDPNYAKYAGAAIGAVSLITALIQTIANTLRYAQQSEGHRVAGISWGKFQRFISIELSLHPDERMEAINFLKMARIELDRLIEQSPAIPENVIHMFEVEHRKKTDIKRPEIAGGVEHTRVFTEAGKDSRLVRLAAEAALMIAHKKKVMSDLVVDEIDKKIVDRAREERAKMDAELRAEMERVAREAAATALLASNSLKVPKNAVALNIDDDGPVPAAINLDIPPPAIKGIENAELSLVPANGEKKDEKKESTTGEDAV
jgi:hypothetical protein